MISCHFFILYSRLKILSNVKGESKPQINISAKKEFTLLKGKGVL